MEAIKIEVTGNIARVIEKPAKITSGTVGLPVEFTFDSQWEGLSKIAVFKAGHISRDMPVMDGATAVPMEVLAKPNVRLNIGVYGVNEAGSIAVPTIWENAGKIYAGAVPDGNIGTDFGVAKKQYDEAVLAAEKSESFAAEAVLAAEKSESFAAEAEDAASRAEESERKASELGGFAENTEYELTQIKQDAINAQHSAEEAAQRAEAAAERAEDGAGKPKDVIVTATFDEPVGDPVGIGQFITNGTAAVSAYEIATEIASGATVILVDNEDIVYRYNGYRLQPNYTRAFFRAEVPNAQGITVYSVTIDNEGHAIRTEFTHEYGGGTSDAVLYTPQTLTPEQQAQARENIGAAKVDNSKIGNDVWSSKNTVDQLAIMPKASGDVISISDASNLPLNGLTLYGKTTQNGTPTPEVPVALESVGKDGSVTVKVMGKNLLPFGYKNASITVNGVTVTVNNDGSITWSGTATGYAGVLLYNGPVSIFPQVFTLLALGTFNNVAIDVTLYDANGTAVGNFYTGQGARACNLVDYPNATTIKITAKRGNNIATSGTVYPMIVGGTVSSATYEPYIEPQTITVSTPNGLPGIPVSSGGNYTDENGQQWICDEIDFAGGVYVQRVKQAVVSISTESTSGGKPVGIFATADKKAITDISFLCEKAKVATWSATAVENTVFQNANQLVFVGRDGDTLTELQNKFNGCKILYVLANPIETALSAEELAQYAALHTYKPNTTITSATGLKVDYVADTKLYIDNRLNAITQAIISLGGNI